MKYSDFYNYLLKENELKELLNTEQNKALKELYTRCRDALKEIHDAAIKNGVTSENYITYFPPFFKLFKFRKSIKNPNYEISKPPVILVVLSKSIMNQFPNISSGEPILPIVFLNEDDMSGAGGAIEFTEKIPLRILVNTKLFFEDWIDFSSSMQHELQHLADIHQNVDFSKGLGTPKNMAQIIEYYLTEKEINSHAKQIAYLYYKYFPDDEKISIEKFIEKIGPNHKMSDSISFYMGLFENPIKFKKHIGDIKLNQSLMDEMRAAHHNFMRELIRSFNYFKKIKGITTNEMWVGW